MTTGISESARKVREMCSFPGLLEMYPAASVELAPGVLHALVRAVRTDDDAERLFDFLFKEAESASDRGLQALAMQFLIRREMENATAYVLEDDEKQGRMRDCIALLSRTHWEERLTERDWKTVQKFMVKRLDEEAEREYKKLPPLFDHDILDNALINTCNWSALMGKRLYRIIPKLYSLVVRRVAGHVRPVEYQSGRYLPESDLFRGIYHLRTFDMPPLELTRTEELVKIGRDVLRMTVLCGDAGLMRGLSELDAGRAVTLFSLVAMALDEMDIRKHIESIMPIPQM